MSFVGAVSRLLDVPSIDPDDARRRKLLNILLVGAVAIALAILATMALAVIAGIAETRGETSVVYLVVFGLLLGLGVIFIVNRYWSGWLASTLFVLMLVAGGVLSDTLREVALGRGLVVFVVPIVAASVLLHPAASFAAAAIVSLVTAGIAVFALQVVPPVPSLFLFFAVAVLSWLSARTLEHALHDLRILNRELDRRVEERTREVAEALSRNQAILEGIADGVIVFDRAGSAIVANPPVVELLGLPAGEIVGRGIGTLVDDDVDADDREMFINLLAGREARRPSVKFEWGEKTLSASVAPVAIASGEVIGTVAVVRDFTREAELDRMKSAFVSTASHELRTPLNAILGYADMLRENACGPLLERQRDVVERIIANAGGMMSLASNLLDHAQIEAGKLTLDFGPFRVGDLVNGVVSTMAVLAQAKGLELSVQIADRVPVVLVGDRQRLQQILINLVSNAIKFTDRGTVCIHLYRRDRNSWALEVSDPGCGIPPEARAYIFEPFRQVDDSLTREHGGVGLGLSIVKELVTLMGGEIQLESEVGRGSTFTIVLPLTPVQEGQP
jgi:PAS domain S-box-containing protein